MKKVLILKGLPASGKTTFAKEFVEKNLDWVRVNRDDLRRMRGKYWLPKQEDMITRWEVDAIKTALSFNKNVIVDATNFNTKNVDKHKKEIEDFCKEQNIEVEFVTKVFDVPLEECIKRDIKRADSVGEKVIKDMYKKYIQPNEVEIEPLKQDNSLPKAIICDLDGSLALHKNRTPFEYHKCYTDLVNEPIKNILNSIIYQWNIGGIKTDIIFLSGREDSCKSETERWLKTKAGFSDFKLYMRKSGDFRKDTIVKKEIFENKIKNKYYIDFVIDDRPCVIRMWKELGLFVFNVGDSIEF